MVTIAVMIVGALIFSMGCILGAALVLAGRKEANCEKNDRKRE